MRKWRHQGAAGGGKKGLWRLGRHRSVSRAWSTGSALFPKSGRSDALARAVFSDRQKHNQSVVDWGVNQRWRVGTVSGSLTGREEQGARGLKWEHLLKNKYWRNLCKHHHCEGFFFLFVFLLLSLTVLHGTLVVLKFTLKHLYLAGAHDMRGEGGNWCPWKGCCQG